MRAETGSALAAALFAIGAASAVHASIATVRTSSRQHQAISTATGPRGPIRIPTDVNVRLNRDAADAALKRLESLRTTATSVEIQCQSDVASVMTFLDRARHAAGAIESLRVSAGDTPDLIRAQAVLSPAVTAGSAVPAGPWPTRPFAPSWRRAAPGPSRPDRDERRRAAAARAEKQQQARALEAQRSADHVESIRRDLRRAFSVIGILNDGRGPLAMITRSAADRPATLTVRTGDAIGEARVTAVDEKKGEVTLAVADVSVVLRMGEMP